MKDEGVENLIAKEWKNLVALNISINSSIIRTK